MNVVTWVVVEIGVKIVCKDALYSHSAIGIGVRRVYVFRLTRVVEIGALPDIPYMI